MVYRPSKKKNQDELPGSQFPANRPSADPLEGPLQGSTHAEDVRKGDDRNLVIVDQGFAEADVEDKLWLFWQNNGSKVIGLAVLILIGFAGWAGWVYFQKQQVLEAQAAYQQVSGADALLAFAQSHAGTPLGRVAQLRAADELYAQGKFKDAAAAYATAVSQLGADPLAQRARLGQALATLLGGDAAAGRAQLEALAGDTNVADGFRAEAGYYVATLALQSADFTGARTWIDKVEALPEAGAWGRQATDLAQLAPALGIIAPGSVPTAPATTISAPGLSPFVPTTTQETAPSATPMLAPQASSSPAPLTFPPISAGAAPTNTQAPGTTPAAGQ